MVPTNWLSRWLLISLKLLQRWTFAATVWDMQHSKMSCLLKPQRVWLQGLFKHFLQGWATRVLCNTLPVLPARRRRLRCNGWAMEKYGLTSWRVSIQTCITMQQKELVLERECLIGWMTISRSISKLNLQIATIKRLARVYNNWMKPNRNSTCGITTLVLYTLCWRIVAISRSSIGLTDSVLTGFRWSNKLWQNIKSSRYTWTKLR